FDEVAAVVERLAALAAAGATQQAAWEYLAETAADVPVRVLAAQVARLSSSGMPVAPAFLLVSGPAAEAWRGVGAVLGLVAAVGAPASGALRRAAANLRSAAELHRTVRTSVAGPAASARTTMLLPPGTALLGWAFGFDVPGAVFGNALGAVAALLAGGLLVGAALWSRRLIRTASRVPWQLGLGVELVALAVRAGLPTVLARRRADEAAAGVGLAVQADGPAVDAVVGFADRTGVPLAPLLDAEAERIRRSVLADASAGAAVLAVRLLLPLGALVLPAFLLLGALPVGIAVLSSTALPL
ncbi:MAG: tight adherence protein, partial [Microbacteriaceae bacterium]|nr:tight adherence protein [Microbacteriaceae bacterium]